MAPVFWALLVSLTLLCGHSAVGEITSNSLQAALEESKDINYEALYVEAVLHLDMENTDNVTTKVITLQDETLVVNSSNNCSDIRQVEGIPWTVNNSAMRFNSTDSYVNVSGRSNLQDGMSASLWVKRLDNVKSNCSICTVNVNSHTFYLRRVKNKDDNNDEYELSFKDESLKCSLKKIWDWNMISITIKETHICLFDNGVDLQSPTTGMGVENCVDFTSGSFTLESSTSDSFVSIALNSPDGCEGLEVDEVAMWPRALNMSELMALRVQPFNCSCPFNLTVNLDFPVDVVEFKNSTPVVASKQLDEIANISSRGVNTAQDVVYLESILLATASKGLLNDSTLDEATQKSNRESFVAIANVLVEAADSSSEAAEEVHVSELISGIEEALSDVYFSSTIIKNETISTEYINVAYVKFSAEQNDVDKIYQVPNIKATLRIPKDNFRGDEHEMVVMVYKDGVNNLIAEQDDGISVTPILSLQLPELDGKNVDPPIYLTFTVANEKLKDHGKNVTTCKYFDLEKSKWRKNGVKTETPKKKDDVDYEEVTCITSHLTNFAVLMSPVELEHNETLSTLTYILLSISIICLLITLVVLMCLREISNTQRVQILKQFIFALMIAQLLFAFTSELFVKIPTLCKVASFLSHYFWLSAFTWMLVQGVQLYTKVRRLVGGNIKQLFYIMFAWGFPLPIALGPLIITLGRGDLTVCWIPSDLIWFFAVPVIVVFCVNIGVTILVMKTFLTVKVNKDKSDAEKLKSSMRAVIVMVPVLGLTWAFGFLLLVSPTVTLFQYLFAILNCSQGVFVFLLHLVLNEDVRSAVLKRRNKVAANTENTIFTKLPRNRSSEQSGMTTDTSKAPLPSDSSTNM